MSNTLFTEAIAEAKLLKETAEQNAKNAIIEAVTPKIRSFIEEQLLNQDNNTADNADILSEVATDVVKGPGGKDDLVELGEDALVSLLEMFSGEEISAHQGAVKDALKESVSVLDEKDRQKLSIIANKLNQNVDFFENQQINNEVQAKQESSQMPKSEVLYEVDLEELASMTSSMLDEKNRQKSGGNKGDESRSRRDYEDSVDEGDWGGKKGDESRSRRDYIEEEQEYGGNKGDESRSRRDYTEEGTDVDVTLQELMNQLGIDLLSEDIIEIDLGDAELPDDVQLAARLVPDEEEELELDVDVDVEDDEVEDIDVEEEEEIDLDELVDVDEESLVAELRSLRRKINEAKELTKVKGIKNDMSDSWGGKGDGKSGLKGAYGGTGGGKTGVDGSYGGGKASGDVLKVTLNKLSEAVKNERRRNRALANRLNEYRSAVETLREQLTDLNLFNAKLLYVNKLLQNKDVSAAQRNSVVESIDNAKSLREVKLVYRTLTESFSKDKSVLKESSAHRVLGSSSRTTGRASVDSVTGEVDRWARLAGIDNTEA
tara:strand:- start:1816 stop:3450 length:1635 start_codon:yes stop_codon:yes gene_type:complete